jgi:hypothetical protein
MLREGTLEIGEGQSLGRVLLIGQVKNRRTGSVMDQLQRRIALPRWADWWLRVHWWAIAAVSVEPNVTDTQPPAAEAPILAEPKTP